MLPFISYNEAKLSKANRGLSPVLCTSTNPITVKLETIVTFGLEKAIGYDSSSLYVCTVRPPMGRMLVSRLAVVRYREGGAVKGRIITLAWVSREDAS